MTTLCLILHADSMPVFFPLLQEGVKIQTDLGCSVNQFLIETLHISSNYIEDRIPTILLNGKAIEDLDAAILESNAVLALSSAMPGLVGATLRRGGHLSSMRSGITYQEDTIKETSPRGTITVKFFNALIRELGPKLLSQGFAMLSEHLVTLLHRIFGPLSEICAQGTIDDQEVAVTDLLENNLLADTEEIYFQIKT